MSVVTERLVDAVQEVSPNLDFGPADEGVVSVFQAPALVRYRLDRGEHARRQRVGLGAVLSPDIVNLMLDLPLDIPVPVASLQPWERQVLRSAPRGTVRFSNGEVARLAMSPTSVDLAVVPARNWRTGLVAAGRFAPFCARIAAIPSRPRDLDAMLVEARYYGVGVISVADADLLASPAPFVRRRFTTASWQFLEAVYENVLTKASR